MSAGARPVRAPRGTTLTARSWSTEAPLRMLRNNLDPEVAERPDDLVVYGGTGKAAEAVSAALSKQGSSYVYGAKGPSTFDCSGLMQWAYKQAGISIGGSTKSQVSEGRSVSASQLKPGDLIFYYSPVSHVSMYVGNGKAVHAPTEGDVVKVDDYQDIAEVTSIRRIAG